MKLILYPKIKPDYTVKRERISIAVENVEEIAQHLTETKFKLEDLKVLFTLAKLASIEVDRKIITIIYQEEVVP